MRPEPAIALDQLVGLALDSAEAHDLAAQWAGKAELTALFRQLAADRHRMARDLEERVARLGHRPRDRDTALGTAYRVMARLRGAFVGERPSLLLEECERADIALAHGLATIDSTGMPAGSARAFRAFHAEIVAALGRLAAARIRLRAG